MGKSSRVNVDQLVEIWELGVHKTLVPATRQLYNDTCRGKAFRYILLGTEYRQQQDISFLLRVPIEMDEHGFVDLEQD